MWTLHLFSTLTSCLDRIRPLSSRPARAAPSNPWLSDVLREHRSELRAAERKWHKSKDPSDLSIYQSLLSSFSAEVHTAKASYFHNKISSTSDTRKLFKTLSSTTSFTADDFVTFFTDKTRPISSQFSAPHMQELKPTTSTAESPLFTFCPLTEAEVSTLLLSSTLRHALLIQSPRTFSKLSLLHSYQHTHTHQHISPHRH